MPTWSDVAGLALALPDVVQGADTNGLKWEVHKRYFAYERPLRKRDYVELDGAVPQGPLLGVLVADLNDKRGLIGSNPEVFFTFPQSVDYPAVTVLLDRVSLQQLGEVLTDAWLVRAPKRLAASFLDSRF